MELPPDDMQKLLVANTVSIINIRIIRWLHPAIDLKKQVERKCVHGRNGTRSYLKESSSGPREAIDDP